MLALAILATIAPSLAAAAQPAPCSVAECLKRLASVVRVEPVSPGLEQLFGTWSFGGGLGGSFLYVFEDRSYIYTEWADIISETVYHKGTWQVADEVLVLAQDSDVTWDRPRDGRFLVYRAKSAAPLRLLGLDRMLDILEKVVRESPGNNDLALKAGSFSRKSGWRPGEGPGRKADIMRRCWNPSYFASPR